jgi:hypothetical protein
MGHQKYAHDKPYGKHGSVERQGAETRAHQFFHDFEAFKSSLK